MMKFGDMAVVVSDAKKAAKWYHEKLGFEIRSTDEHWVTVGIKGSEILFHLCEQEKLEPGNSGIGFLSHDVKAEQRKLEAKGVKFTKPTTRAEWGTFAMFADRDGNEFWISEG